MFVAWGGLAVNIDGLPEAFQDPVERAELREVLPAVHVLVLDVQHFLPELFGGILRETRLTRAGRTDEECGLGRISLGQWREDLGQVGDLCIPMLDFLGDEAGPEDTRIGYHVNGYLVQPI